MNYKIASVDSIVIHFSDTIDELVSNQIINFYKTLKANDIEGIIETIPSFTTLYIQFDIFKFTHETLFETVQKFYDPSKKELKNSTLKTIPVYYGEEVAIDLQNISKQTNLSIEDIIKLHTQKIYKVFTIGFAPGFGYLGTVNKKLQVPRLKTFREKVPAGSVALANEQCAVYPSSTPGGWNIIGKTPIEMFDETKDNLSYLQVGDSVKFESISKEEFLLQGGEL